MMVILTYKIGEKTVARLRNRFKGKVEVLNVSNSFTDLLAIPCSAVVIDPEALSYKEISCFNEVFGNDFDTCVICIKTPARHFKCIYTIENDLSDFTNLKSVIGQRMNLENDHREALLKLDLLLSKIKHQCIVDSERSLSVQTTNICNNILLYEKLYMLIERLYSLDIREKVPYRAELNYFLIAIMNAYGIFPETKIGQLTEDRFFDQDWFIEITELFKENFNRALLKNRPEV